MRWPFVSREAYEERGVRLTELTGQLRDRIAKTDELTAQLVLMKKDGFTAPIPRPVAPRIEPTASDEAINEVAAGKPTLRRHLQKYRDAARRGRVSEEQIADRIRNWRDPAETDD